MKTTAATNLPNLDFSMLGAQDLANLVLQRSKVLWDVRRSGRVISAWSKGNAKPLTKIVASKGPVLAQRAFGFFETEFEEMRPLLDELSPKRVADIGCGYAFIDLFFARHYGAEIILIDIETNDNRHFGFENEAAAYTSLDVAKSFLTGNGVAPASVVLLNPEKTDPMDIAPVDLATSFLSCGFHYPVSTYMAFFRDRVKPNGMIILDLRLATKDQQIAELETLGSVQIVSSEKSVVRVAVRKGQ